MSKHAVRTSSDMNSVQKETLLIIVWSYRWKWASLLWLRLRTHGHMSSEFKLLYEYSSVLVMQCNRNLDQVTNVIQSFPVEANFHGQKIALEIFLGSKISWILKFFWVNFVWKPSLYFRNHMSLKFLQIFHHFLNFCLISRDLLELLRIVDITVAFL